MLLDAVVQRCLGKAFHGGEVARPGLRLWEEHNFWIALAVQLSLHAEDGIQMRMSLLLLILDETG